MKPEDLYPQHTKTSPVAWSDASRPGDGPGADVPPRPAPGPLSTIAPAYRAVDQLSGKIAELEAENASLRDKLEGLTEASDALIDELHEQLREAQAQRDQARAERDTAQARLQ